MTEFLLRDTGGRLEITPRNAGHLISIFVESAGVFADELRIQDPAGAILTLEQVLTDGLEKGLVTTQSNLRKHIGDSGAAQQHPARSLWILELDQPRLGKRVDRNDSSAVGLRLLQRAEHSRMVRAGVLTGHDQQIRLMNVFDRDGTFADPDRFGERRTGGLVAHI